MMRRILLLLLFIGCLPNLSKAQTTGISFSFTLPHGARTSAGVFAEDGTLIRTLWNNEEYGAGTYRKQWDGLDDDGNLASNSKYKVTVQYNIVKYEWEGARIGNTSKDLVGGNKHRAFSTVAGMAIYGNYAYYCTGFNEGTSSMQKFALNDKQVIKRILSMSGHQIAATSVTTDGKLVYWAGYDAWGSGDFPAFIIATKIIDDTENIFSSGQSVTMNKGRTYKSAINVNRVSKISGISVMKNSKYLFVAQGTGNEVRVLDKVTGRLIHILKYNNPGQLLVDRSDKYLWMINGLNGLQKFPINSDGTLGGAILTLSNIVKPLAFDLSPDNNLIVSCDGNNGDEKVKAFSTTTGAGVWTMGSSNYETDPNVSNDKFYFINRNSAQGAFKTFVSFEQNGSFWIGDTGNYRMQHYSQNRTFIDRIMYLKSSYNCAVDINDPTRVFDEYLEFKIDYSKRLEADNGSWELVRNYRAVLNTAFFGSDEMRGIFKSVATLNNGRTYATLKKSKKNVIVELPKNSPLRFTGIEYNTGKSVLIMQDGSVRTYENRKEPNLASFYTQDLKGFDASNNPIWSPKRSLSEIPVVRSDPHDYNQNRNGQITKSGLLVSFNANAYDNDTGYHLGAIKLGDNKWLWKTSKSTSKAYKGEFPADGTFDIGNGVTSHSAGAGVFVIDNNILWNYNGEFWKNSQTNYWNHFNDNGLMVGQFGTWRDEPGNLDKGAAKMAGNSFSGIVVKVGEVLYVYQNDESQHSGIHRWKISGLNTIKQIDIPIELSKASGGLLGQYYDGSAMDNANIKTSRVDSLISFNWLKEKPAGTNLSNADNFSVTWRGFVTPLFSENYTFFTIADDGVRLSVDGKVLIDNWKDKSVATENSGNIQLVAGKRYSIQIDYYEKQGNSSVGLSWKSLSQKKQIIPSSQLLPAEPEDPSTGINLMAHLSSKGLLQNGLYGWNRNPARQDSSDYYSKWWSVTTGTKNVNSPDVSVVFRQPTNTAYYITRNLGDVNDNISEWNLSGNISFNGNYANTSGGGSYFEVLDNEGKIISRLYTYTSQLLYLYLNNSNHVIARGSSQELDPVLDQFNFVNIKGNSAGITVQYGPFGSVNAPILDPKSNWKKPKTLRLYFFTVNKNSARTISIQGFRFKTEVRNSTGSLNKSNQSITFPAIGTRSYGETFSLSATSSSNLPVSYSVISGPAKISGSSINLTGIGIVVVEASQAGSDQFEPATSVNQTFAVKKGVQTISFTDIPEKRPGDPAFNVIATSSSNLPVSIKIKSGPAKISGSKVSLTGVGKIVIEASQAGNSNYNAASAVTKTLVVAKGTQTITFADIPDKKPTDPAFNINATASSGLPVSFRVKSGPAKISGTKVTLNGAGKVTVEALQNGNTKFNAAQIVSRSFNVGKASQTITFANISDRKPGDPAFNISAKSSSGLPVSFKVKSGPAKLSGSKVTLTGTGKVTIEASQAGNSMYIAASTISKSFNIGKSAQTITFADIPDKKPGDAAFNISASASSGLPVLLRIKSGPAKISGTKVTLNGTAGTVVIEALQSGNSTYNAAAIITKSFTVQNKINQTIDFPDVVNRTATLETASLLASSSSGLPVNFMLKSGPAKISDNKVTVTGMGTIVIQASQPGNDKYNAAPTVTRSFIVGSKSTTTVVKLKQSISFPIIGQRAAGSSFLLSATATSGLPVSFRIKSGTATISGSKITLKSKGKVVVEAYQSGNDMYNAAENASQTIIVVSENGAIMALAKSENVIEPDKEEVAIKTDFKIYPNPATISTTVEYILEQGSNVILELFNSQSILINRIILGNQEAKSTHEYKMDTANLPMGIYIIRLLSAEAVISKRLVIVNK